VQELRKKKICMLGAFAVGKTSLVARFVKSIFSDRYLTTVGVKIEKKMVRAGNEELMLMLWDLAGEDEFMQVQMTYLRGSAGYFLVVDGTRRVTLDKAIELQARAEKEVGRVPFLVLLNKADLQSEWEIEPGDIDKLLAKGWTLLETSAKSGANVEAAFQQLGERMMSGQSDDD
jgi:small GTP-binding protein